MLRSSLVAVLCLAAAPFVHVHAQNGTSVKKGFRHFLILECEDGQALEPVIQAVEKNGNQVRRKFESKIFRGLSVKLVGRDMEQIEGVKKIWRVQDSFIDTWSFARRGQDLQEETWGPLPTKPPLTAARQPTCNKTTVESMCGSNIPEFQWPHIMTQVDLLHKQGFIGSNITIGLVDSGVGCKVAFGDNLAQDKDGGDPMDCTGHGTAVAGVLAGYDEAGGFVGVAPNATLGAYRVLDCNNKGQEDDFMAGLIRAFDDGVQIIVSSAVIQTINWASSPSAIIASRIVSNGVPCIIGVGNLQDLGLFSTSIPSTGRGVIAVTSFGQADDSTTGAILGSNSASGPTWDLDIKPNVGAPGRRVRLVNLGRGYTVDSGTSFAAPFIGGIVALIAEARRTFDPILIASLLTTYAAPQINPYENEGSEYYSVARQGGGLVQAWEACRATTLVHPSALIFNDTDHRPSSIDLAITNKAESEVTYELSNLPALSVYTLTKDAIWAGESQESISAGAAVTLSENSLRLRPGQSATIQVSASEPQNLDTSRLPVWSGWIAINGSDGSRLTIPYQGLGGSLQSATIFDANKKRLDMQVDSSQTAYDMSERQAFLLTPPPANSSQQFAKVSAQLLGKYANDLWTGRPVAVFYLVFGSPQVQIHVVPLEICTRQDPPPHPGNTTVSSASAPADRLCVPESMVTDIGGVKSLGQVLGYPKDFVRRGRLEAVWDGSLARGEYAPPGSYKLVARALAIFGDANNQSHWQTVESVQFAITYNPATAA
ncbi:peptidase S8 and DUF1034 (Fn-like) domain protein [Metarhizium robertsii]|uniref:Peptidase S8 and DUF1034 (Fn-like) domain protein n=1 Tax=Metarhizium robertsii TaxID=568076 RepID=A0A0A1UN90_9HYPO|nr:peptidase S8 and DUF1034 (Fn-like) domain protein [Metarhizium robertsii]